MSEHKRSSGPLGRPVQPQDPDDDIVRHADPVDRHGPALHAPEPIAVVLAGGTVRASERLLSLVAGAAFVVAADGGLANAERLALRPNLIVGDFDSVTPEVLDRYPGLPQLRHPRIKDSLDLELALDEVDRRGWRHVVVVGALGDRVDQTLAAVLIAACRARTGTSILLANGVQEVWLLSTGDVREPGLPAGTVFSVSSLVGDARVDVEGARFELTGATLPFGVGIGVSNEAGSRLVVRVIEGLVALTVEWEVAGLELEPPAAASQDLS